MTKILILEDETSIRSFIRVNLKKNGFEAVEAASGEEALEKLKNKMLLLGYRDYPDVCEEIAKMIEEGMKAREKNEAICGN